MTPGARVAAAAGILEAMIGGARPEQALSHWARGSRYAGSKDRAAVRDLVFDAWRRRRSYGVLGGGDTGRALMLGAIRARGEDPRVLMSGERHDLAPPTADEAAGALDTASAAVRVDMPDWAFERLCDVYGDEAVQISAALQERAPVFLRVNLGKTSVSDAQQCLSEDGILTEPHDDVRTALRVTENERRVKVSRAYLDGLVELQDASSQAAMAALPLTDGMRVLDYCAGGGGKSLAMAALAKIEVDAHDANPARMKDLPERARRGGHEIAVVSDPSETAPYDLVLVDAPCSGSGTWRRDPDGKWRLTAEGLADFPTLQASILCDAAKRIRANGILAYATCSIFPDENSNMIAQFVTQHPQLRLSFEKQWLPTTNGDGFYLAILEGV